jgi:hypothetical protein
MHCVASEAARTLKVTEDGMVQMLDTRVDFLRSSLDQVRGRL